MYTYLIYIERSHLYASHTLHWHRRSRTWFDSHNINAICWKRTHSNGLKPGFHSNAITCVGKQPIMVATASTEHSYWQALAFLAVFVYTTRETQAIAFEWKPGLTHICSAVTQKLLSTRERVNSADRIGWHRTRGRLQFRYYLLFVFFRMNYFVL